MSGLVLTSELAANHAGSVEKRAAEEKLHWILRIAIAAEFIGHGAFGLMGKEGWLAYYEVFGIGDALARSVMPVTGTVDIALGILVIVWPMRAPLALMAFWGLFTAALRPVAGEGVWELLERTYNFGVPLGLLLLWASACPRHWLARIQEVPRLSAAHAGLLMWVFRAIIGAYLIGHGGLGLFTDKPVLIEGYESVGLTRLVDDPHALNEIIGLFEIGLGLLVFAFPANGLLLFVLAWKLGTEMLYVTMGSYGAAFEVIERGGAYAAPLALIYLKSIVTRTRDPVARHLPRRGRAVRTLVVLAAASVLAATACSAGPARSEVTTPPSSAGPANDAGNLSGIAERILSSVVSVEVRQGGRSATGSGFRVAIPGIVVINAHIVQGADDVSVVLRDGTSRTARMLGSAPDYDIAVLEVDDSGLPPLHSGSGLADARVGDPVLAIGHPHGRADAVTSGALRALNQPVRLGDGGAELRAVQTDAAITPDSSGGPLVNARGEVLGVLTAIATPHDATGSTGSTFAIPVDVARRAVLKIARNA